MQTSSQMAGMPQQQTGQPPFMQNSYPGMPGGFNPHMVPPAMGGYPGQPQAQHPASVPLQMTATPGADNSVVAHKLPSSQVFILMLMKYPCRSI